jgi:hypothetical protein
MHRRFLAALLAAAPVGGLADRGALSLDGGAAVAGVRAEPPRGYGDSVTGSLVGVTIGTRYAFTHNLEICGVIDWYAPATFYNDNVTISTSNGVFIGQLQSQLSAFSVNVGAQYVTGLVWRLRAGALVGWLHRSYTRMDLIDVSQPGAPRSFGLGLGSYQFDNLVVSPMVGIEWLVSDHFSLAVTPRVEVVVGSPGAVWLSVPLTVSYSWYGVFQ